MEYDTDQTFDTSEGDSVSDLREEGAYLAT
jgi:hypothetical protein